MQDRYVGDVGDYGKYALLRSLAKHVDCPRTLAVVWCAFPDESHNGDGRHISYLTDPKYAAYDPDLYLGLQRLVGSGRRTMADVEEAGLLPSGTRFFREPTTGLLGEGLLGTQRKAYREAWLDRAYEASRGADIVFFDPDNGIGTPATPRFAAKGGKFVYWDEMRRFWDRGQSLVVYHHLNRTASVAAQEAVLRARFLEELGHPRLLYPVLFRRGSCRHFWVVGQSRHEAWLVRALKAFAATGWAVHCELGPIGSSPRSRSVAGPVPTQSTLRPMPASTSAKKSIASRSNSPSRTDPET